MKILRIVLVFVIVLLYLSPFGLLLFLDIDFIQGWPQFLSRTIFYALACPIGLFLNWLWPRKKKQEKPKEKISKKILSSALVFIVLISLQAWTIFITSRKKTVEYLHSPNNENVAVMQYWNDEEPYEHGYIYVVQARFFYKTRSGVFWTSKHEDRTFTWIDDNTLEVVYTHRHSGKIVTEYLHW